MSTVPAIEKPKVSLLYNPKVRNVAYQVALCGVIAFLCYAAITNAMLVNSSTTIGTTNIALGATATSVSGLTLASPTFSGTVAGAGTIPNSVPAAVGSVGVSPMVVVGGAGLVVFRASAITSRISTGTSLNGARWLYCKTLI